MKFHTVTVLTKFFILISFSGLVCTLFGCSDSVVKYDNRTFDDKALKLVEDKVSINLPSESRGLNLWYYAGVNPRLLAKIEVPMHFKESLVEQVQSVAGSELAICDPLTGELMGNPLWDNLDWWNPSLETCFFKKAYISKSNHIPVTVFLCEEGGRYILYVDRTSP